MSNQCNQCGSYAINHHHHGRDGSDPDLCDVCYWHTRNDQLQAELAALKSAPVVMPERRIQALAGVSLFDLGHAKGWNACIDEVARLNRSKT